MLEELEYYEKNGSAVLYRCYGTGSWLEIPKTVGGLVITELADHCFAEEASFRVDKNKLKRVSRSEWEGGESTASAESNYPAMCATSLEEIALPEGLVATGDYAFYGCRNLKKIIFPATFRRLGGGNFVACRSICDFVFGVGENETTPYALKDVLSELSDELSVKVQRDGETLYKLIFPRYSEETVENTPARIIEVKYRGAGYMYRNCLEGRQINFKQYDGCFYIMSVWDYIPSIIRVAMSRLQYPLMLEDSAKADYLKFLRDESKACAEMILSQNQEDLLELLDRNEYFTPEILAEFLEAASVRRNAAAVSFLMDCKKRRFPVKKRRYEF